VLLLSIAKWHNSLTSQLLVYNGDRPAPLGLLNLLPEGADSDPDTWLMHHILIPAFLCRIASASNIQHKILQISIQLNLFTKIRDFLHARCKKSLLDVKNLPVD
jgi:hypothetical protein